MVGRGLAAVFVMGIYLAAGLSIVAAQSTSVSKYYDTSRTEALTGRVSSIVHNPQRMYIVLAVPAGAGAEERWAIGGRTAFELGWTPKSTAVNLGDTVTVVVYRARPGAKVETTVPVDHTELLEIATAGRLVHGTEMTLPNGTTLEFGER